MSVTQAQAILYGLAIGDALGYPTEFMSMDAIRQKYGPSGISELPDTALFSDDTQMTVALAEALIEAGHSSQDGLMSAVGRHFVEWLHSPENNRAPGRTCIAGVEAFERGVSWRVSGLSESKGCGSAMRVAPVGYFYQSDPEQLKEVARASSMITHRHPAAIAAAVAAAYLVKLALDGCPADRYLAEAANFVSGIADDMDDALLRVGHVLGWGDELAAMRYIGQGWVGEEAVALALYCVMRSPDDYKAAIRRAANFDGDTDSIACIAGGIAGARLGLSSIPDRWRTRIEKSAYLADLGVRLASSRSATDGGAA